MEIPNVVIIGRPNVGKSSLFNCLIRRRVAIVDAVAGVTRDRISHEITHEDRVFQLVDTGGIGIVDSDDLSEEVERQIAIAMTEADVILYVVDVRSGLEPLDHEVATRIRKLEKPAILVANKVESDTLRIEAANLNRLGFGKPMMISSREGFGRNDLLDEILNQLGDKAPDAEHVSEHLIKVALVGKRNTGKSTLLNRLAGSDRVTVSDVPGTTRDSVDVTVTLGDKQIVLIDTAGVRRKKSIQNSLDFYSTHRTELSIRRCDVVLMMVDAGTELSKVDKKLADYISTEMKPVVVVINKWDLTKGQTLEDYEKYLMKVIPTIRYAPIAAMSALKGTNIEGVFQVVYDLFRQAGQRVGTGELNRIVQEAVAKRSPAAGKSKILKLRYVTQVGIRPPHIVVFVNDKSLVRAGYTRYLAGQLRAVCPYQEVPIRIDFRSRRKESRQRE